MIVGRILIWHPAEQIPIAMAYDDIGLYHRHLQQIYAGEDWIQIRKGTGSKHEFDERIKCASITKYRSELF